MDYVLRGIQSNKRIIKQQIKENNTTAKQLSKAYLKAITFNTDSCRNSLIQVYSYWMLENTMQDVV